MRREGEEKEKRRKRLGLADARHCVVDGELALLDRVHQRQALLVGLP